jgi:hypothetical protein
MDASDFCEFFLNFWILSLYICFSCFYNACFYNDEEEGDENKKVINYGCRVQDGWFWAFLICTCLRPN